MNNPTQPTPDLSGLSRPCTEQEIEWRVGSVTKAKDKGMALAYLTNRAVQDRFDEACGQHGWRNEYKAGPTGGVICGLSVRVTYADGVTEWVTKWDGSDTTDIEATKGGLSGSMKRAAVQWGVGRDLYDFPTQWVALDDRGRFAGKPRFPKAPATRSKTELLTHMVMSIPNADIHTLKMMHNDAAAAGFDAAEMSALKAKLTERRLQIEAAS